MESAASEEVRERQLMQEIARCPIVAKCKAGEAHPCSTVVAVQKDVPLADHQVPEPWTGHLGTAVLVFVSSNPSISEAEAYPRWSDGAPQIAAYFDDRFEGGPGQVRNGVYGPLKAGGWSRKATRYWAWCRARAAELMPAPRPGVDYALTEVVHCKSHREIGVKAARDFCSSRYLPPILDTAASAAVVAVVGAQALPGVNAALGLSLSTRDRYAHAGGGTLDRHVVFFDHPAGFGKIKRFESALDAETLVQVRTVVSRSRTHSR
jgi:hypothetical protein